MTDDSIEAKALALLNEVNTERNMSLYCSINRKFVDHEALCRALEQHEAFKQEVSDVMTYIKELYPTLPRNFNRFIIPKPKPDPLAQTLGDFDGTLWEPEDVVRFRAALEARGLKIVEKGQ
jgi:hypothetical protein